MSKEFIERRHNSTELYEASEQQDQLEYFTEGSLQNTFVTSDYVDNWANRNYQTSDPFLNWIKSIFKTMNFVMFSKYLRNPIPSTKIIKNNIESNLMRVLYAENSSYTYEVRNKSEDDINEVLKPNKFNEELFYRLLYRTNDIIVEDVKDGNSYRYFVEIGKVISLLETNGDIDKIAFKGCAVIDDKEKEGIICIDDRSYQFYDLELNLLEEVPHDLGVCPADFISDKRYKNSGIIRESLFSFIRPELEEYVFLKTLQKLTYPNGAFPVAVKLGSNVIDDNNHDIDSRDGMPSAELLAITGEKASINSDLPPQPEEGGILQTGSTFEVEAVELDSGGVDTTYATDYITFHYIPVEVLKNIDERISKMETDIKVTIIGSEIGGNEAAQNTTQIEKSVSSLENSLFWLSNQISNTRNISDSIMLKLQYGKAFQSMFAFCGTDFYLDSIDTLMTEFEKAPNPIERKDLLVRINNNKYKNQPNKKSRNSLLYDLMPFCSDKDFEKATELQVVDAVTMDYQLRFNYWISQFEAEYGDIVTFYDSIDADKNEKLLLINNLILSIINKTENENDLRTD